MKRVFVPQNTERVIANTILRGQAAWNPFTAASSARGRRVFGWWREWREGGNAEGNNSTIIIGD